MKIGSWARLLLAAAPMLAGCGNFWQSPGNSSSFTLTNSGAILVSPGASTGNTSTITVTAGSSFTGTVALSCAVTKTPSSATSPTTCGLSSTSVSTSGTSTLTATTTSSTTTGIYQITVTGTSGSVTETTAVCVNVTTSTTTSCTSTASTSGDFYILNSSSIAGYYIKAGVLTALNGSTVTLPSGATPWAMAVDPTGKFLYVSTDGGILFYNIGTGGKLTQNTAATLNDITSFALQVDSTGQWLLDASNTVAGPVIFAWPISPTTGLSTLGNGINTPAVQLTAGNSVGLGGLAISKDNKLVAVAAGSATETLAFTAGSNNTGATSPFTGTVYTTPAVGTAVSVAFDPSSSPKFLYIGETGVYGSTTNSGALRMVPISGDILGNLPSPYPSYPSGGTGPHSILAASNGYVYVANWAGTSAGNITSFLVDASTPALTVQSNPASTGKVPYGMAEDSTGSYVMTVNNQGSTPFSAFTFSSNVGQLDSAFTGSTGTSPVAIVAVP